MVVALLLLGFSIGRASDKDETVVTVQVNSADHEVQEGYFALGEQATVMVKPGSDLYQFLSRQRGEGQDRADRSHVRGALQDRQVTSGHL